LTWAALTSIPVGVIVERRKAHSPWADDLYRAVAVLHGVPATAPGTQITSEQDVITFYAGDAVIALHPTDTTGYRDNLASGSPLLWVVLRSRQSGLNLEFVTADPAEGEALTGSGNDLVESVPMPSSIRQIVEGFIAEHHVEQPFYKRERSRSGPSVRRAVGAKDDT
jgi:hypothetical protein